MPVSFMEKIFEFWLWAIAALWLVFLLVFILQFLLPKVLLKSYFKAPYFKSGELIIFSGFPFTMMRTLMFMRLVASPQSGKKRGLTEAYKIAPAWFRVISKVLLAAFFLTATAFLIPLLIFGLDWLLR